MKKLFIIIFSVSLSNNAFGWGTMKCDKFLDAQTDLVTKEFVKAMNRTSSMMYFTVVATGTLIEELMTIAADFNFEKKSIPEIPSNDQIISMIEKKCRDKLTQFVWIVANEVNLQILADHLKRNPDLQKRYNRARRQK